MQRYLVFNHQEQPVEIYLDTRVLALGPGENAELAAVELDSEHLKVLRKMRLIGVHGVPAKETDDKLVLERKKSVPAASEEKHGSSHRKK